MSVDETMMAAHYTAPGPAATVLTVGRRPAPLPAAGEVRVRLATSGVNPSDVKSRNGLDGRAMAFPLIVPHSDGAGVIDRVGDGVPTERVGERVWIWNGQWRRPFGTAAGFIALPAAQAVPLPAETGFAEGACLGIPALTAYQGVKLSGAGAGDTLLVSGGAGAVGRYAIQMAKARGARVVTTVSSAAKAALARTAGADLIVDYRREDAAARILALTDGRGVDAIVELDLAVNGPLIPRVLRPHGTVAVYGLTGNETVVAARWLQRNTVTLRFFLVYDLSPADRGEAVAGVTGLLQAGRLTHAIDGRFPLDRIADAHARVESGQTLGNVILDLPAAGAL